MTRSNRSIQCAPLRVAISRNAVSVALALVVITLAPPALAAPPVKHAVVNASSGNPSTTAYQSARATCPPGLNVVSGGYALSNSGVEDIEVLANHPSQEFSVQEPGGDPITIEDGWLVSVRRTDGVAQNWAVLAYAVCVKTQ